MKKKLLLIALCILPCLLYGKSDLTKQEKAIVKALKKQYKLESVEIERPYDGFVYYQLMTKDSKWMIADSTGQVIIPRSKLASDANSNRIRFVKGHTKGLGSFREKGREAKTITAYYPGNEPVFVASKSISQGSNEYKFYSIAGDCLASFNGYISEDFNSPVYISKDLLGNYGLMALDGRILLPNNYTAIDTRADGICTLYQIYDGMERKGGACISDLTEIEVPCIFNHVKYSQTKKCWMVQVHEYDSIQVYREDCQYDMTFEDEGQKLFELHLYEEARKYYTLIGSNEKWASFYIGASYFKSIIDRIQHIESALHSLEKSTNRQDRSIAAGIQNDLKLFYEEKGKAEQFFNTYLKSGHQKYVFNTKEMLYEISEMKSQTVGMEERISTAVSDLERRCVELDRIEQEEYNRRLEQQRINVEQQRLNEQRLAREQKEREIQKKRMAEMERRYRENRKREKTKRIIQQQDQQKKFNQKVQYPKQKTDSQQQTLEEKNKELKSKKPRR